MNTAPCNTIQTISYLESEILLLSSDMAKQWMESERSEHKTMSENNHLPNDTCITDLFTLSTCRPRPLSPSFLENIN